jgi:hypothetical protein
VNEEFYFGLARRYGLLTTGGSDFHGPDDRPGVNVGSVGLTEAQWRVFLRRARRLIHSRSRA